MATDDRQKLEEQIKQLEDAGPRLPPVLQRRLQQFRARLESLKKEQK